MFILHLNHSHGIEFIFFKVFAFVRTDKGNNSPHRADCHVCECLLEFRTKAEVIRYILFTSCIRQFVILDRDLIFIFFSRENKTVSI